MTTLLLIRHGLTDAVGQRITGRLPGVPLNEIGRQQAEGLPERLKKWKIDAIYSSPLERTMETAGFVARQLGMEVVPNLAFAEYDFGAWSGLTIAELDARPDWHEFCRFRSNMRAPGGELITEVVSRMVEALGVLSAKHPEGTVAVFSHADAIKAALMHYLGMPLDFIYRLDVTPASINVVRMHSWGVQVAGVNG